MPQSRLVFFSLLVLRGFLYGFGASVLAGLFAHFVTHRGWDGIASALNGAGTILWILGASFMWGAFSGSGREVDARARVGQSTAQFTWPLKDTLLALIAGSICFLLLWIGNVLFVTAKIA